MKSDISFSIIGCGKIGTRHAGHIHHLAILSAVCDTDEKKAILLAEQYQVPYYLSIEELLAQNRQDVLSVCTPNGLHAAHSIAALKAGCHVVCEKPMAIRSSDCCAMIAASAAAAKQLFIVKQNRFNEAVVQVKQLLAYGSLGKILSFQVNCFWNRNAGYYENSWHGSKDLDGGTLFTQFSHFIDILYWFLGDVASVQSYLLNAAHKELIETEDTGVVILNMKNGAVGTLHYTVNSFAENMEGSVTLFGENGTVKIGGQYLNTISYQQIKNFTIPQVTALAANNYGDYQGSMSNHQKVYENVLDVLCHGSEMSTNAGEGLKTVEIIEQIYKANSLNSIYCK